MKVNYRDRCATVTVRVTITDSDNHCGTVTVADLILPGSGRSVEGPGLPLLPVRRANLNGSDIRVRAKSIMIEPGLEAVTVEWGTPAPP